MAKLLNVGGMLCRSRFANVVGLNQRVVRGSPRGRASPSGVEHSDGQSAQVLSPNHIEAELAQPVEQHVRHRLRKRDQCGRSDVPVLGVMLSSLQQEPHYAMCERHLIMRPLFRAWSSLSVATAQTMCSEACKVAHLQSSDHLFRALTRMSEAYCVIQGRVSNHCEFDTPPEPIDLGAGCWLSEAGRVDAPDPRAVGHHRDQLHLSRCRCRCRRYFP